MAEDQLFQTSVDAELIAAYERHGRTLDDLPYTDEFEVLYREVCGEGAALDRAGLLHKLLNLRKAGKLPTLGRAASSPPRIAPEQERSLTQLVEEAVGQLSKRDRLPHTPEFESLVDRFNAESSLNLSHHDAWRVIAKLAK